MKINSFFKLVIAIVVSEFAGVIGSFFTFSSLPSWYAGLVKPILSPPGWLFGPVWAVLYALMGVAAFLIWSSCAPPSRKVTDGQGKVLDGQKVGDIKAALILFGVQLALNTFWSIIFFGLHNPGAAFVEIVFLWLAILATIITFARISKPAAWLLAPYIFWVSFAGYLNYSIWQINAGISLEQAAVRSVVENFGHTLKNVSLLSETATRDIEQNYKDFLDPALLVQWKADPSKAVGRLTSSPWPDEIAIADIRQFGSGAYDVSGKIIDMTSAGMAGSRPVEIGVVKFGNRWLITGVAVLPSSENELWKDYSKDGILFQYPEKFTAQYISTQEWPPAVKIESGVFSCQEKPGLNSVAELVEQRVVDNRIYCVDTKFEGAAGSVYASYVYTTPRNGKLVEVSFVLRYPNCSNYDEVRSRACTGEREAFDLDATVDRIVQTIKWDLSADNSLAGQLAKCLPMSDMASWEKCKELLKQITDFDSCVMAGFSIMKSNPSQCATPDGRIFTEER
jgi:tryptophan-rich sensory protein